ncbi:MAG: phosphodiester glycosidase family protein [Clostridia bacterium]|nr:phosphodiester glycosidase family protein [Clostridia bacterium]
MYRTFRIIVLAILLLALLVLVPSPRFVFAEIIEYDLKPGKCIEPYEDCYLDEWHYEDPSISVSIEKGRMFDTNYMVARVKIANASQLRTEFTGSFYAPDKEQGATVARRVNAVLAINGDYYCEEKRMPFGYTCRQGKVYKNKINVYDESRGFSFDVLIIDENGDFHIERAPSPDYLKNHLPYTPINGFTFGPGIIIDGEVQTELFNHDFGGDSHFQRMAIAQVGPLEYMCICCEGPEDQGSAGMTIYQFAELCASFEGIQNCYNLDGGSSTTIVFRGQKVNSPTNPKHRWIPDIIYFATAYLPD